MDCIHSGEWKSEQVFYNLPSCCPKNGYSQWFTCCKWPCFTSLCTDKRNDSDYQRWMFAAHKARYICLHLSPVYWMFCGSFYYFLQWINYQFSCTGAFLVNTGSSQLLDDCAVKQLLIDETLAGCALDGAEGPQWMEAWVYVITSFRLWTYLVDCIIFYAAISIFFCINL